MTRTWLRDRTLILLVLGILAIFIVRTLAAAAGGSPPRLSDLFTALVLLGSLALLAGGFRRLRPGDWLAALALGALVGAGMLYATLFSPYPVFGVWRSPQEQAVFRGVSTALALLGGAAAARMGGPVLFHAAGGSWRAAGRGVLVGLAAGIPLALLNVFALQLTQGRPADWQNPGAALLDALQPAVWEEAVFRYALWGLLWLALRGSQPGRAVWLSGGLALLVHNFIHFDELLVSAPLAALGMGIVMSAVWGLPLAVLARKRGFESAVAFHWLQDVLRFFAGY